MSKYRKGWHDYLSSLHSSPKCITSNNLTTLYDVSLMAFRAHEDKHYRGAIVASLSHPGTSLTEVF